MSTPAHPFYRYYTNDILLCNSLFDNFVHNQLKSSFQSYSICFMCFLPCLDINQDQYTKSIRSVSLSKQHRESSICEWRNGLQVWRVAANILNKQSRTADKGWLSKFGVGQCKKYHVTNDSQKLRTWTDPLLRTKQWKSGHRLDCSGSGQGQVAGTCECGNEHSGSIK